MITKAITVFIVKSENGKKVLNSHKRALDLQATLAEFGVTSEIEKEIRKVNIEV